MRNVSLSKPDAPTGAHLDRYHQDGVGEACTELPVAIPDGLADGVRFIREP
jgi:hypothetical protein